MKKLLAVLGILVLGGLVWYLFIKPYEYVVTIKAHARPGTINQTIKAWHAGLKTGRLRASGNLGLLEQELQFHDSVHQYRWEINALNDSTSRVTVYATDPNHSLMNKISIPFSDTDFEKRTRQNLYDFYDHLKDHLGKFKVTIIGTTHLPPSYCAYVKVETSQFGKAKGMMYNAPLLGSFLVDHGIPLNGRPFLQLTAWDRKTDSIAYDFCYPIIKRDSLPQHPELHYKDFEGARALKAVYNGNYITSDRAWYALMDHASNKGFTITGLPIEVFHTNPNMGGNEMEWVAEVYLPIAAADE